MSRYALIPLLASGCFYTDPINQRPSTDIKQTSSSMVYRGALAKPVVLAANPSDPDGTVVSFQWRAYLCTDASEAADGSRPGCDVAPFYTEILPDATFKVPANRADVAVPVQEVFVTLEAKDDHGATARPIQTLRIAVIDQAPDLALQQAAPHGAVVNTPIDVFAKVGDADDGPANVAVQWQVFSPATQPLFEIVDKIVPQDPNDPDHLQLAQELTPHGIGEWHVQVTATDPLGIAFMQDIALEVMADSAPWLAQWSPIAAPAGDYLPLTDPTLFQVPVVVDDLDPYPAVPGDTILGVTTFAWSLKVNGGTRQVLDGVTTNHVALDPAAFTLGDHVELRVEIQDRNHTPITCADGNATCSVISDNARIQRLTWAVEIR